MALNAYLRLKGETQGYIRGSVTQAGREDSIMVIGLSHEVVSPRDAASGLPTGKRQHKPLIITKEIDWSTPSLMTLLTNNERISEFRLDFWKPSKSGKEYNYYTIELLHAKVAGIETVMFDNKFPENMQQPVREKISFVYSNIIKTEHDLGTTAEDVWETRAE
jgi:type VI secretion system secreted protein Hcp